MARKNTHTWTPLEAVDLSINHTSEITDVQNLDNIGISVSWSGTSPIGELFVEVTNDTDKPDQASWIWTQLDFGAPIAITGNTGSHLININQVPFTKMRLQYEAGSGIGQLTARQTMKQLGS